MEKAIFKLINYWGWVFKTILIIVFLWMFQPEGVEHSEAITKVITSDIFRTIENINISWPSAGIIPESQRVAIKITGMFEDSCLVLSLVGFGFCSKFSIPVKKMFLSKMKLMFGSMFVFLY